MIRQQELVEAFHKEFGILWHTVPTHIPEKDRNLRFELMREELIELALAMTRGNMELIADGIADLLYVVYGTAVSYGIDAEPIFNEVHRSNMSKKGGRIDEKGKWIKPENYSPPVLLPLLISQGYEGPPDPKVRPTPQVP